MSILIASDCQRSTLQVQAALFKLGQTSTSEHVTSISNAATRALTMENRFHLVVFVMSEDPPRVLHQVQSLKMRSRLPVVVVGPAFDPNCILETLNHGADHFIDQQSDLVDQFEHCLRRYRRDVILPVEGKLISVISACGGSGVSVIASNLAVTLAQEHQDCVLLDFNPGRGDQASLFNLSPRHCLSDICENLDSLDRNMLDQSLTSHRSGVRILAANEEVPDLNQDYGLVFRKISRLAKSVYPRTVIDHSISFREEYAGILKECDSILIAIRMDFISLKNLEYLLIHLEKLNVSMDRVHLVANRVGSPHELPLTRIKSCLGRPIQLTINDAPQIVNISVNCGTPAVLESATTDFSRSIRRISETVVPNVGAYEPIRKPVNFVRFLRSKLMSYSSAPPDSRTAAPIN